MKVFTVRLDDETNSLLEDFCQKNQLKISDAFRALIRESLKRNQTMPSENHEKNSDLLQNEKIGISASVESLFLLRNLVKDKDILELVAQKTEEILKDGWARKVN